MSRTTYFFNDQNVDVDEDDLTKASLLNIKLQKVFPKEKTYLNVAHINAQSVTSHYTDLMATFSEVNVHAILVSETWLKHSHEETDCALPEYSIYRRDRNIDDGPNERSKGGGVCIYICNDIECKEVRRSPDNSSFEYLFIEITVQNINVLLGVVYSPRSDVDYFKDFEMILKELKNSYEHVIVMGDFNTCLLKSDSQAKKRSKELKSLVDNLNCFLILNVESPEATHYQPSSRPSLLDLAIVAKRDRIDAYGQFTTPFSYHDLIFLVYDTELSRSAINHYHERAESNIIKNSSVQWLTVDDNELMAQRDEAKLKWKDAHRIASDKFKSYEILQEICKYAFKKSKLKYTKEIQKNTTNDFNDTLLNNFASFFISPQTTQNKRKLNTEPKETLKRQDWLEKYNKDIPTSSNTPYYNVNDDEPTKLTLNKKEPNVQPNQSSEAGEENYESDTTMRYLEQLTAHINIEDKIINIPSSSDSEDA